MGGKSGDMGRDPGEDEEEEEAEFPALQAVNWKMPGGPSRLVGVSQRWWGGRSAEGHLWMGLIWIFLSLDLHLKQNTKNVLSDCFLHSPKNAIQLMSFSMHRSMAILEDEGLVLASNSKWERCSVTYGKEKILALSQIYQAKISLPNWYIWWNLIIVI